MPHDEDVPWREVIRNSGLWFGIGSCVFLLAVGIAISIVSAR